MCYLINHTSDISLSTQSITIKKRVLHTNNGQNSILCHPIPKVQWGLITKHQIKKKWNLWVPSVGKTWHRSTHVPTYLCFDRRDIFQMFHWIMFLFGLTSALECYTCGPEGSKVHHDNHHNENGASTSRHVGTLRRVKLVLLRWVVALEHWSLHILFAEGLCIVISSRFLLEFQLYCLFVAFVSLWHELCALRYLPWWYCMYHFRNCFDTVALSWVKTQKLTCCWMDQ